MPEPNAAVDRFLQHIKANPADRKKLADAGLDEIVKVAAAHGYHFTREDLLTTPIKLEDLGLYVLE